MITTASILGIEAVICELSTARPTRPAGHLLGWVGLGSGGYIGEACESTSYVLRTYGDQRLDIVPLDRGAETLALSSSQGYQLAFAVAALLHWDIINKHSVVGLLFHGELRCDGMIMPSTGSYAVALAARSRKLTIVTSRKCDRSLFALEGVDVLVVDTLAELVAWLTGEADLTNQVEHAAIPQLWRPHTRAEVSPLHCSDRAKLAVELAISGGHSLLLYGPQASGKSLLVRAAASLLPEPTPAEAEQIRTIHQLAHRQLPESVSMPYRMPHHTVSHAGLLGGGTPMRPGEVTLAHCGVLVLEELAEYQVSTVADVLAAHHVEFVRKGVAISMPCSFTLIATMWPCPCGRLGWREAPKPCSCSPASIARYRNRVLQYASRFDMIIDVTDTSERVALGTNAGIRERIAQTRAAQHERQGDLNASAEDRPGGEPARTSRVARTIADRAGAERIMPEHFDRARTLRWVPEPVTCPDDDVEVRASSVVGGEP